ncbi:MAG TPA: DUF1585 domain-containing protein, partial [Chthonomonadales bacterium]|nr:DUF1585 domain-containing protein [Chthonomonadales bacterium]
PPPPPNVPPLEQTRLVGTLRQQMEEHRKNPMCASCHARMDPIGFGLENYDAIGEWRTMDGKSPVDASGTLPDGRSFNGPEQLIKILMANKAQFTRCLTQKLMIYGLGRGLDSNDRCAVDGIVAKVQKHDYRFSSLVSAIVNSNPFLERRGDGGKA